MKQAISKAQRDYMKAKAIVKSIEVQQEEIERQYIADNGIVNPDGSVPELIYCIDDETIFDRANEQCSAIIVSAGLEDKLNAARNALKAAEDRLIESGLSIVPSKIREVLQEDIKRNACTRFKVIDLVFRLDGSTVKA